MLHQFVENGNGLPVTITPVSGTIAVNTITMRGTIEQIWAKATTDTTTFDLKLTDRKSRDVRKFINEVGVLNDTEHLPVDGKYTLTIENASVDEAFKIMLVVKEDRK
jgi:hypothetical protein